MIAKCERCGFLTKIPIQARNKFKYCYRCRAKLKISYTNRGEYYLKKRMGL